MSAWIKLTREHLISALSKKEREDFGKTSVEEVGDDRVIEILSDLTAEIRGYIGSWAQNATLSTDATQIPPEFKAKALSIARWRLLISIPGYSPGKSRELDFEKADAFFNEVAKGRIRPAPADDAVPNTVPDEAHQPGVEVVTSQPPRTGRAKMNGL